MQPIISRPKCNLCPLGNDPLVSPVPADGPRDAKVLFLGEAPGRDENRIGRPFVGRAGDVLQGLLNKLEWDRSSVVVTNTCLCRPPENRTPTDFEVYTCTKNFFVFQSLIDFPFVTLMIPLGKTATEYVLGEEVNMMRTTGRFYREVFPFKDRLVYPMLHPAATFRLPIYKRRWEEDGDRLRRLLTTGKLQV